MKPFRSLLLPRLAALALGAAAAARAQSVIGDVNAFETDARNYNLITLGNATLGGSSDTQGAIAVGGNLAFGGTWTIASNAGTGTSDPSLYVNGQMTLSGTEQLNNGYASTPNLTGSWSWSSSGKTLTGGGGTLHINASGTDDTTSPISNPGPASWNWSSLDSNLDTVSSDLASAAATGTISVNSQNLEFTTTQTSGVAIFDLDAALLSGNAYDGQSFSNIEIDVPSGVNYVINVLNLSNGQTLFGSGVNFNSGTNDDQLLWNFSQSTDVTIDSGGNFYGSILAPSVNITDDTTIDGQVVADSFTDDGVELHDLDFTSVVVPEPRSFALWAGVLCGAVVVIGRRGRRTP